eukprot:gene7398-9093_t
MNDQQLTVYHDNLEVILHDSELEKLVLYDPHQQSIVVKDTSQDEYFRNNRSLISPSTTLVPQQQQQQTPLQQKQQQEQYCPLCSRAFPNNNGSGNNNNNSNNLGPGMTNPSTTTTTSSSSSTSPTTKFRSTSGSFMSSNYFMLLESSEKKYSKNGNNNTTTTTTTTSGSNIKNNIPIGGGITNEFLNAGYYKKFFKEHIKIGSGGFGAVFLCKHLINGIDLGEFAVKKVPVGENVPWLYRVLKEVKALETLQKHQNIINYKHSWLEYDQPADFGPSVPCLYILMEFANSGNLQDYMIEKGVLSEMEIWSYLCHGIGYLHHSGIIHRDLKPQNILLHQSYDSISDSQVTHLMISDFGTCDIMMPIFKERVKRTGNTGTIEYLAPELLQKNSIGEYLSIYDKKCDIWSLGVLLYQMTYGTLPFKYSGNPYNDNDPSRNLSLLIQEIENFNETSMVFPSTPSRSKELKEIISVLLRRDPLDRPTISQILSNPFIQMKTKQLTINPINIIKTSNSSRKSKITKRKLKRSTEIHEEEVEIEGSPLNPSAVAITTTHHHHLRTSSSSLSSSSAIPSSSSSSSSTTSHQQQNSSLGGESTNTSIVQQGVRALMGTSNSLIRRRSPNLLKGREDDDRDDDIYDHDYYYNNPQLPYTETNHPADIIVE